MIFGDVKVHMTHELNLIPIMNRLMYVQQAMSISPLQLLILLALDDGPKLTGMIAERINKSMTTTRRELWGLEQIGLVNRFRLPNQGRNSQLICELTGSAISQLRGSIQESISRVG